MFVGWIRQDSFQSDLELFAQNKIIDKNLVINTVGKNPLLGYAAYDDQKIFALITAYEFDTMILVNNFFYLDSIDQTIKERLVNILMKNLNNYKKPVVVLARTDEKNIFEDFQFQKYTDFKKALYKGASKAFNFSQATAKSISNENFISYVKQMDQRAYFEDRSEYLMQIQYKSSSFVLSSANGYQHSYAIAHNLIKISPWINQDGAFDDAQKFIRGLIYHRGLKQIVAFVPAKVQEIIELYTSYGFEMVDDLILMYANEKPKIDIEKIYAF